MERDRMKRWSAVAGFVLFIALCASTAYWATQFFKPPARAVAASTQLAQPEFNLDAAAGLFGGRKTATLAAASNYVSKGVVVAGNPSKSVAIIAVDGKPAQAIGVDTDVVRGVSVKEVHTQYVLLSEAGAIKRVPLQDNPKTAVNVGAPSAAPVPVQPSMPIPPSMPVQPSALIPAPAPIQATPQISPPAAIDQPASSRGARSRRRNSESESD
jgi:general secretion pathway protein C